MVSDCRNSCRVSPALFFLLSCLMILITVTYMAYSTKDTKLETPAPQRSLGVCVCLQKNPTDCHIPLTEINGQCRNMYIKHSAN